LQALSGDTVSV